MARSSSDAIRLGGVLLYATMAVAQQPPSVIEAGHKGHAVGHEQEGVNAVRVALTAGGDADERDESGWTPLMHAALECRAQIVKLLLEHGADPKLRANSGRGNSFMDQGQTALTIAAGCFINRRRAELAPERGMPEAYIESERIAPQMIVHDLIDHGAAVDAADAEGRTPLMMAAMQGWSGVIRELLASPQRVRRHPHYKPVTLPPRSVLRAVT
jgi:hypothetical protein